MKRLAKGVFPLVVALLLAGQIYAQPAAPSEPSPTDTPPSARLTPAQMRERAEVLSTQIRADEQHVLYLQSAARKEKDVIKLSCVNDRFVSLKAEANLFDVSRATLVPALDSDDRFVKFDAMSESAARVRKAREEADRCVGAVELGVVNALDVSAPELQDDPTKGLPFSDQPSPDVEPPGYASPYN